MPPRAPSSTAFRATWPRPPSSTKTLAERGKAVAAALEIEVPEADLVRRLSGRWICQANGHVYNETSHPPRIPGQCDLDDSPLIQRDDDRRETVVARLTVQLNDLAQVVGYYREQGLLRAIDGRKSVDEVTEALSWPPSAELPA